MLGIKKRSKRFQRVKEKTGYVLRINKQIGFRFINSTLEARRKWNKCLQIIRENNFQSRILYLTETSIKYRETNERYFQTCKLL